MHRPPGPQPWPAGRSMTCLWATFVIVILPWETDAGTPSLLPAGDTRLVNTYRLTRTADRQRRETVNYTLDEPGLCASTVPLGDDAADGYGMTLQECATESEEDVRCTDRIAGQYFHWRGTNGGQCKCAIDDCSVRFEEATCTSLEVDSQNGSCGFSFGCARYDYAGATAYCNRAGTRLCSVAELTADITTGSGCGFDERRVWTGDACRTGEGLTESGHFSQAGSSSHLGTFPSSCTPDVASHPVRCCADAAVAADSDRFNIYRTDSAPAPPGAPPPDRYLTDADESVTVICQSTITVYYESPTAVELPSIVIGSEANGVVISLYPGVLRITTEMRVCDAAGQVLPDVVFYGETDLDYTTTTGVPRSIALFCLDVRTQSILDPVENNLAPTIMSVELYPQTASIGDIVTVTANAIELNDGFDYIRTMGLDIYDNTAYAASQGNAERSRRNHETDHSPLRQYSRGYTSGRTTTATFFYTPTAGDFVGSDKANHLLVGTVTATDSFGLAANAELAFAVARNRPGGVTISQGPVFTRPRVSLDPSKQTLSTVRRASQAVVKLDVFDPDVADPPIPEYVEGHTYRIDFFGDAVMPGRNNNTVATPSNCAEARGLAGCRYIRCTCTPNRDAAGNEGCNEIQVTSLLGQTGGEWTFEWNPWGAIGSVQPGEFGVTYCQLRVHFVDNATSASGLDGNVTQVISEGLDSGIASILLEALPGPSEVNHPPTVRLFYASNLALDLNAISPETRVTVTFEDADSDRPTTSLGYANGNSCDVRSCFREFVDDNSIATAVVTDAGERAWQGVYTFDGTAAVTRLISVRAYLRLVDAVTGNIGYHQVATLRALTDRRHRRQATAAIPQMPGPLISIDATGRLSASMDFDAAVVQANADNADNADNAGGASSLTPDIDPDRIDDTHASDEISDRQQLEIILALVGGVGCCCLLGVAICLGYAVLRNSGTARVGSSPSRRPTKVFVSAATPGHRLGGPRLDPFAGFSKLK